MLGARSFECGQEICASARDTNKKQGFLNQISYASSIDIKQPRFVWLLVGIITVDAKLISRFP